MPCPCLPQAKNFLRSAEMSRSMQWRSIIRIWPSAPASRTVPAKWISRTRPAGCRWRQCVALAVTWGGRRGAAAPGVPVHALCIIVGNLLENAVTACAKADSPFIRMRGRFADGILTIVMDNRYTDICRTSEGSFRSRKPGGGTGLWSVRSIAEKYGGGCRFEAENTVFSSSVYLRLD